MLSWIAWPSAIQHAMRSGSLMPTVHANRLARRSGVGCAASRAGCWMVCRCPSRICFMCADGRRGWAVSPPVTRRSPMIVRQQPACESRARCCWARPILRSSAQRASPRARWPALPAIPGTSRTHRAAAAAVQRPPPRLAWGHCTSPPMAVVPSVRRRQPAAYLASSQAADACHATRRPIPARFSTSDRWRARLRTPRCCSPSSAAPTAATGTPCHSRIATGARGSTMASRVCAWPTAARLAIFRSIPR